MEIISIASFFIAIIGGIKLLDPGIALASQYIEGYEQILPVIVFTVVFIGILLLLHWLGQLIKKIIDLTLLGSIDDIVGALLGIVKWALIISIFLWVFASFGGKIDEKLTSTSIFYEPVADFAPTLFNIISSIFPFIEDLFRNSEEYVKQKEFAT